ncbi:MAG: 3-deoxy-D-manno-octulosonic acid kinase [Verrucomicrobiae bacterium]|nr:3-deoxy-D-manno-octulosonic acid kinase [Verrucomicrobiae bacterium]
MTRYKKNGIAWEIAPDFADRLDAVLAAPGQPVKQTPTKLVTEHRLGDAIYYVKRYRNPGLRPLKFHFKPAEARNEWQLAGQYAALGIPLVRHLALGERRNMLGIAESILITEGFPGRPLSRSGHDQRREVQIALGRLLRLMHDKGVLQPDLHHNILVHPATYELRRIDVDRGELKPALTDTERIANLAWLNIGVPLSDDFFTAYGADAAFVQSVRQEAETTGRARRLRQARRALGTNLRFERQRHGELNWFVRLDTLNDQVRALLADPDGALEKCSRLFKTGPNRQSTVGAFNGFILKRYNQKNRWNYLKDLFRPSRAFRAYRSAYHLELLGIATPRPVAAAERRCLRVLLHSYLVTEEIAGATDLRRAETLDVEILRNAGKLIGQLHAAGFAHGDLKETNIVWDKTGKVYLLDLDGLEFCGQVSRAQAEQDLERFERGLAQCQLVTAGHREAFRSGYAG